jgi:transposase
LPPGKEIEKGGLMLQPGRGKEEGERIAVGIDPCKEFLQLAILSPGRSVEFRKVLGAAKWALLRQAGRWGEGFYLELLGKEVQSLTRLIRVLQASRKEIDEQIRRIGEQDEEVRRLRTFPGIDYLTASTLLGEIGDIERFENEGRLSSYCGVSPVMWQSGTSRVKAKRRKRFSRRLKGVLYFISLSQIRINPESRQYYWRKRREGKTHWQAMNALSRQVIKIIYYMLKNKQSYYRKEAVN